MTISDGGFRMFRMVAVYAKVLVFVNGLHMQISLNLVVPEVDWIETDLHV